MGCFRSKPVPTTVVVVNNNVNYGSGGPVPGPVPGPAQGPVPGPAPGPAPVPTDRGETSAGDPVHAAFKFPGRDNTLTFYGTTPDRPGACGECMGHTKTDVHVGKCRQSAIRIYEVWRQADGSVTERPQAFPAGGRGGLRYICVCRNHSQKNSPLLTAAEGLVTQVFP